MISARSPRVISFSMMTVGELSVASASGLATRDSRCCSAADMRAPSCGRMKSMFQDSTVNRKLLGVSAPGGTVAPSCGSIGYQSPSRKV